MQLRRKIYILMMRLGKKLYNALACVATVLLAAQSCSSFLDQNNPLGREGVYDTEKDLEASLEGVMAGLLSGNGLNGESTEAWGCASGLIHWGQMTQRLTSNNYLSCLKFTQYSANAWNGNHFRGLYTAVFRANALLAALPDSPVEDWYKVEVEAEARLYRAVAYFHIVRKWGDAPLWLEEVDFDNANSKARAPWYKVYAQIIDDLEYASEHMRSPKRADEVASGIVRPNRFAAVAYLSSVYVTLGSLLASPYDNFWDPSKEGRSPDFSGVTGFEGVTFPPLSEQDYENAARAAYTQALEYAEMLIPESATHEPGCGYKLLSKFGDLFTYDYGFSRDGYTSFRNPEQVLTLPVSVASDISNTYAQYQLPQYPAGTRCTASNEQFGRIRPTRWAFQHWCFTYPGVWRSSAHTEYLTSSDPRLDKTFYYNSMEYCEGQSYGSAGRIVSIYPATISYSRVNLYPYFRKYASPNYNVTSGDADIYDMRFAEVYFNAIEAAAWLGDEAKAYKYMDVIHARARHSVEDGEPDSEYPKWTAGEFATKEELMTRIFWERIYEFFGENHEWYETHRHGAQWLVDNIAVPKNEFMSLSNQDMLFGRFYPEYKSGTTERWAYSEDVSEARKGLLSGFPANETLYNSGIENNGRNDYDFGL